MSKIAAALNAIDNVLDELPEHIRKLKESSGLKPLSIDLKFTGSIDIDKKGGADAGLEASANIVEAATGVPVSLKAGVRAGYDNQGAVDWEVLVRFG